jgi:hypothetical protein
MHTYECIIQPAVTCCVCPRASTGLWFAQAQRRVGSRGSLNRVIRLYFCITISVDQRALGDWTESDSVPNQVGLVEPKACCGVGLRCRADNQAKF